MTLFVKIMQTLDKNNFFLDIFGFDACQTIILGIKCVIPNFFDKNAVPFRKTS